MRSCCGSSPSFVRPASPESPWRPSAKTERGARTGPERERVGAQGRRPLSWRQLLLAGAATAAGSLLAWRPGRATTAGRQPRIAIVGGGLAGLTAALTLQDQGYAATIYEALESVGDRTRSDGPGTTTSVRV